MVLFPLSSCCCFSTRTGSAIIMTIHLVLLIGSLWAVAWDVVFGYKPAEFGFSTPVCIVLGMFYLIGLPTILGGLYGVHAELSSWVRLYLWYALAAFAMNLLTLSALLFFDVTPCGSQQESSPSTPAGHFDDGAAMLCGWTRIAQCGIFALVTMVQVFCLWVVWSYCENVLVGTEVPTFTKLLPSLEEAQQVFKRKLRQDGPYAGIVGVAHTKMPTSYPPVGVSYGALFDRLPTALPF
mmetsp:Transcript_58903/g.108803  ORF Transcript_58903/g.108803 Transcript_58903/m.108803 type:complete len:238 (+) Transcript_58903:56-769(+)